MLLLNKKFLTKIRYVNYKYIKRYILCKQIDKFYLKNYSHGCHLFFISSKSKYYAKKITKTISVLYFNWIKRKVGNIRKDNITNKFCNQINK